MAKLENGYIRLNVDERGQLTHFENLKTSYGNIIKTPAPLFRLNLHTGTDYEDMAFPEKQELKISVSDGIIYIRLDKIVTKDAVSDIKLEMRISLDGDHVNFEATLDNRSESVVSEFFYPCIGMFSTVDEGKMDLYWPEQLGKKYLDIETVLLRMKGRQNLHRISGNYPGFLSMPWMMLTGKESCLYCANYDPKIHVTTLRAVGTHKGGVALEFNKMCFAKPGECFEFPKTVARLYKGDWKEGAQEYASYASGWRKPVKVQDWVRRMNGYFLVINKQQYGNEMWPYDTLPQLYELACAHGYDTLGLFGWYSTGHDNNYPDLEVSESMGGREKLQKNIKAVQDAGGHVTLYFQGHLIDVNSDFYRKTGYKLEGRTLYNNPYYEFYPKACLSDFARTFSRRVFATVCPSCPEWHELMAEKLEWVHSLGADGILYDQIGGMPPYPCFNPDHPHMDGRPSLSYTQGRIKLLSRIRKQAQTHENFAFFSEHITDVNSQFLDCVHGIGSDPGAQIPAEKPHGDYCGEKRAPEMFRYCFPETNVTIRNPSPCTSQRFANYGLSYGLKYEMELRYQTDKEDVLADYEPEMRIYCKAVSDLRRKYEKYLLLGTYQADRGIENPYETLVTSRFEAEDGSAVVVLWNDSKEMRTFEKVKFEGRVLRWETLHGSGDGMISSLKPDEIAVLFLG